MLPEHLGLNEWGLAGEWTIGREHVDANQPGGTIAYRFHARDANLVLLSGTDQPIHFHVHLDGEAPGESGGLDVDSEGHGVVRDGRLYQLVRQVGAVHDRTLEIEFMQPGAQAYVFTCG